MTDRSSDGESSESEIESLQSSHSSASSHSSRSADSSSREGGGGSSAASLSVASSRSDGSTRSAASSRSSRSRSSSRSSSSSNRSSPQSSVASRSDASSFDIEDAVTEGIGNSNIAVALGGNNNNHQQSNADHNSDDDSSVSSGPPTSASDSHEGSSRSPFTEAESAQSKSEVSGSQNNNHNTGGEEFLNGKANGHSSPQSSSDHHQYQRYQNGRPALTQSMVAGAAENLSSSMNQGNTRVPGGPLTSSMIAAVAAEDSPIKDERKRKTLKPILTQSMIATAAEDIMATPTEGKHVLTKDEVIGSTFEMPSPQLDTKYIKIKLIDPANNEKDDASTVEPIYVTMKIEIPSSQEPSWSNVDTSVGMGQTVQMSFLEDDDKGMPINIQDRRVAIRHDESDRERIKTETDKILKEIAEELSPEDIIQRRKDETKTIQRKKDETKTVPLKKQRQHHFAVERQTTGRRLLRRSRSSSELLASFKQLSEERQNNRPKLLRRRSSIELSIKKKPSVESVPEERQSNRPIRRRSTLESSSSSSSSAESSSVESQPKKEAVENVSEKQQNNNRRTLLRRRRSSAELLASSFKKISEENQSKRPGLTKMRSLEELQPRSKVSIELVPTERQNNRPIRRRSTLESSSSSEKPSSVESSSVESQPNKEAVENVPEGQKNNRPPLMRRRSSAELLPRRTPSDDFQRSVESLPIPEKGLEPFVIPSLITSTVTKTDPNQKVGLAFRKSGGANTVIIDKITPGSPFQGSDLRSGHEIISINGQRVNTARRAAEVVRESRDSLTLIVSNAIRPPGTIYAMLSTSIGMYFKMKNGLVQLMKVDENSPVATSAMKVGDFILAVNGEVMGSISKVMDAFDDSAREEFIPVLFLSMRNLRTTIVDTNVGDREKEWSDNLDECLILSSESTGSLTLRFKDDGLCELVDPLQKTNGTHDHPFQTVVEAINHGIICLMSAIREGVNGSSSLNGKNGDRSPSRSQQVKQRGNDKLAEILDSGLLSEDEFRAIRSKLVASNLVD